MKPVLFAATILLACSCGSTGGFHSETLSGAEGPLTVDFVDIAIQRTGSRIDDPSVATVSFDIANNSSADVTVRKIDVVQRGMSTLRLELAMRGFDRVVEEGRSSRFDVPGRVTTGGELRTGRGTVLALEVHVTVEPGVTYVYSFDVPVPGTEI